ncbi:MAG: methyltransferase, partial [Bacteroidales bacterium]|nr:methyltransferase [Bacteroidales bacterium]
MERLLEQYIKDHSTPEDPVLAELYRQTHIKFVNPNMVCGHIQGHLLEFFVHMSNPKTILEIG